MCKTFKATILSNYRESTYSAKPLPTEFIFYKTKFIVPKTHKIEPNDLYLSSYDGALISDKNSYVLNRVFNSETNKYAYEIVFSGSKKYLKVNWYNKLRLMYVHERFWVQNNSQVIYTAITTLVVTIIASIITYKLGYASGIKDGQLKTQQTSSLKK